LLAEARFQVTGTDAHLIAFDPPDHWELAARQILDEVDARWSRFHADSELSRLNATGELAPASQLTFALIEAAANAYVVTGGRFDATVLGALLAAGYDRDFAELRERGPIAMQPARPASWASVEIDRATGWVVLHDDVSIDLGGIAKGFAADLVANELLALGAAAVLVDLGGDVRTTARPDGVAWKIAVDDPWSPHGVMANVALGDGAIATCTGMARRWAVTTERGDVFAHHLIDPATGLPAESDVIAATVVTTEAVWAAPLAKAAFIAGAREGVAVLEELGLGAVVLTETGRKYETSRWREYSR
jgi:thiamine biosynthesis lipoprotein